MKEKLIGVGASAGGLAALEAFFRRVRPDSGCSFVVIQHLSPDFKSMMAQLLAVHTEVRIRVVEEAMPLAKDHIYLIPAGKLMTLEAGCFRLRPRNSEEMPINTFFQSLAREKTKDAIGIVLSGTGTDGTAGCRSIREAGGLVLAQEPESAEFTSMPESIIRAGLPHGVAPPEGLWSLIEESGGDPDSISSDLRGSGEAAEILGMPYQDLFGFLERLYGINFSAYKAASVGRRLRRRMEMAHLNDVALYLKKLEHDAEETDALYRDLLIGVTGFFRDPEVFEKLAECALRPMFADKAGNAEFRAWVAGCASGEEAYTMAILADEVAREYDFEGRFCIFATDAHEGSVARAAQGVYSAAELAPLGPERIRRWFIELPDERFRVKPDLRNRIVFSRHNLIVDPPFTRMDLVSCRNLLIYLRPSAQEDALRSLLYALHDKGTLLLGSSETPSSIESSLKPLSGPHKIFRKVASLQGGLRPARLLGGPSARSTLTRMPERPARSISLDRDLLNAYDEILRQFAPSGVLVDRDRIVRHYFGDVSHYLAPLSGRADSDFLSLLEGDLKLAVSTSLQKAIREGARVRSEGIRANTGSGPAVLSITVFPIGGDEGPLFLVTFESKDALPPEVDEPVSETGSFRGTEGAESRILMLEGELRATKENLQALVEELQTSNEELQATNEEAQVANEELQSTNEELHSTNEELYTVNAELEQRNQQLVELNTDHENLLANTGDGVVFLDPELCIKKFNPAACRVFRLVPHDLGRPIEHITYLLEGQQKMLDDIHSVLDDGLTREREAPSPDGHVFLRRVTPFRGAEEKILGAVLTFTEITEVAQMRSRLARAMESAKMAWWEWDIRTDRIDIHAEGDCILGYACDGFSGSSHFWFDRTHPDDVEYVEKALKDCLEGRADEWRCQHRFRRADRDAYEWVDEVGWITARDEQGRPAEMAGTTMNIHERKLMELSIVEERDRAREALQAKAEFLSTMSHEIRTPLNGVVGMAELLKGSTDDPKVASRIEIINDSAALLLELINGILDLSKAEAGRLELELEYNHLAEAVESVCKVIRPQMEAKNIKFESSIPTDLGDRLFDSGRLKQVLINLLGNALKFTPDSGEVQLAVEAEGADRIRISVADDGVGFDEQLKAKIFDPFTQGDSSNTRKYGGTGLGLAISQRLINLMGGELDAESTPGKGSTFHFSFDAPGRPAADADSAEDEDTPPQGTSARAKSVLVVDDDSINRLVISQLLETCQVHCTQAESAEEARGLLSGGSFDAAIIDLHMPGESGADLGRWIRSSPDLKNIRLVAYTADSGRETRAEVEEIGFDHFTLKPINKAALGTMLDQIFPKA
ncbi:MAG: chemotaxis protein CheB [Opitutales bacterium]